ncbi:MAG: RDD family protein [Defluviitaleaceae bacterium]|nr:RDD family protein [Defluviitaleaceae bacterium]
MKTHIILTPANIEIEYRLAGAGSRLAAFVIDFFLQIIFCLMLAVVILFGIYDYRFATLADVEGFALGFLIISWFVIYFCYFIVCEMTMNGQSVGKKLFGLRVIRDNGQPIEFPQSLARNLFRAVLDILYIGLFFILFSDKHKRIGDMVAGTIVVAEHYGKTGPSLRPVINSSKKAGQLSTEQLSHLTLSLEEQDLLQTYFARKMYLPDDGEKLQKQWAKYFSDKWQIDAEWIDDALLTGLLQLNEGDY